MNETFYYDPKSRNRPDQEMLGEIIRLLLELATIEKTYSISHLSDSAVYSLKTLILNQSEILGLNISKQRVHQSVLTFEKYRVRFLCVDEKQVVTWVEPIRTRYLGHVTGNQPIRGQYFLIRPVPATQYNQSPEYRIVSEIAGFDPPHILI
eukprot:sb/3473491/